MRRLLAARIAELLRFQAFRVFPFVLRGCVVAVLTISALQRNNFSHDFENLSDQTNTVG